jgi:ABC-type branched-subunit amino acid transport system substrate-binding protein
VTLVQETDDRRNARLRRRRRLLIAVTAVLLLAGGGVTARLVSADQQRRAQLCDGLDQTSTAEYALSRDGNGECTGWTVEQDTGFDSATPATRAVISAITAENRRVRDQPAARYLRVGVLVPMTSAPGSALTDLTVQHALQGALAAQLQANSTGVLGDSQVLVQLVLANEGRDEAAGLDVVRRLTALRDGPHPLVAVTGLGISIPRTKEVADALGAARIPAIGAVLTADDMVSPWLFKVTPSNTQYARALRAYLDQQPAVRTGYLVRDRNTDDNYVRTLSDAFIGVFDDRFALKQHNGGFNGSRPPVAGTPTLFSGIVDDVCALKPDVLFFAGRDRDLPPLVAALKGRGRCENPVRPLLIATGTTGLTLARDDLSDGQVTVLDASAADQAGWHTGQPGTPADYPAFHDVFTGLDLGGHKPGEADLGDGYATMHRDAVAAAVWAARRTVVQKAERNQNRPSGEQPIPELPTASDVHDTLLAGQNARVPGASGAFYFTEIPDNQGWPVAKPVPVIVLGPADGLQPVSQYVTTG